MLVHLTHNIVKQQLALLRNHLSPTFVSAVTKPRSFIRLLSTYSHPHAVMSKMEITGTTPQSTRQSSTLAQTSPDPQPPQSKPSPHADLPMVAWKEFIKPNEQYAADFGSKGELPLPPGKKLAIVTCMDARINVYAELGIKEGDAHIIRNAGGSARDALRSVIISQRLLGTREIAVFHHTGCGMLTFSTDQLRQIVKDSDPSNPALSAVDQIDFLEFNQLEQSVKEDVQFLKESPLVLPQTEVTGWVYEVETGKIRQIV